MIAITYSFKDFNTPDHGKGVKIKITNAKEIREQRKHSLKEGENIIKIYGIIPTQEMQMDSISIEGIKVFDSSEVNLLPSTIDSTSDTSKVDSTNDSN